MPTEKPVLTTYINMTATASSDPIPPEGELTWAVNNAATNEWQINNSGDTWQIE